MFSVFFVSFVVCYIQYVPTLVCSDTGRATDPIDEFDAWEKELASIPIAWEGVPECTQITHAQDDFDDWAKDCTQIAHAQNDFDDWAMECTQTAQPLQDVGAGSFDDTLDFEIRMLACEVDRASQGMVACSFLNTIRIANT